jgi:hypothetical protein
MFETWRATRAQCLLVLTALAALGCDGSFGPWKSEAIASSSPGLSESGCGVAIAGAWAAVCGKDASGNTVVDVYQYKSASSWRFKQRLTQLRSGSYGVALAMDGERLLVSGTDPVVGCDHPERDGYVDVFQRNGGVYSRVNTLEPPVVQGPMDWCTWYGRSLDISGDVAVVGAAIAGATGRAYIYNLVTGASQQVQLNEARTDMMFGWAVAASAGRVAVSSPGGCTPAKRCKVLVYEKNASGVWSETNRLESPDPPLLPSFRDGFGVSLALGPNFLAAADLHTNTVPRVFFYKEDAAGAFVNSSEVDVSANLGRHSLAASSNRVAIADSADSPSSHVEVRRLQIHRHTPSGFALEAYLYLPDLGSFGEHVDLTDRDLLTSATTPELGALFFRR